MNQECFDRNPAEYALDLVEAGIIDDYQLAHAALAAMSHDSLRAMLTANEWDPRYIYEED
jgi:hypothetical protein